MAGSDPSLRDLRIRDVQDGDVDVFFEHELDPEANRMAAFPARQRDAFVAHWVLERCGFQLLPAQHVESLATVSDDVEELVFILQT